MRFRRLATLVVIILPLVAAGLAAQTATLQIRPRVGDTLRMRLDQQTEMTGIKRTSSGEANASVVGTMAMFSRAIVEGGSASGTDVLAVTDSVMMSSSEESAREEIRQATEQMRGQRVHFRVSPDGTVSLGATDDASSRDVAQAVSLMPAAFPKGPIHVGDQWSREMPLPIGTQLGAELAGRLRVQFRFDSLVHNREWAFVSMRGEAEPATGPGAATGTVLDKGFVTGTMRIDQRRHWLAESWFNIVVNSTMTPAAAGGVGSMHLQMHITQHMQTVERK